MILIADHTTPHDYIDPIDRLDASDDLGISPNPVIQLASLVPHAPEREDGGMLEASDGLPERWLPSGPCGIFLCDVASYGDPARDESAQRRVREALYEGLGRSFEASDIPLERCYLEDRGDGVLVAVPPSVDVTVLLTSLVDHLRAEVRRHNSVSSRAARLNLRVAVHTGRVSWDGNGLVGKALNDGFRHLEAPALKRALEETEAALAVIISHRVWEDVVQPGTGLIDPAEYRLVDVQVKETRVGAWIRVPGAALPRDLPADADARTGQPETLVELVECILSIPQMSDEKTRALLVRALPSNIRTTISHGPDARSDTWSIVATCLEHPGGLEALLGRIKFFAADSIPARRFEALVRGIRRP